MNFVPAMTTLLKMSLEIVPIGWRLYNLGNTSVNLEAWFLSDDSDNLQKWTFPNLNIEPRAYLLLFASNEDVVVQYAHTNFKLAAAGETLSLSNAEGILVDQITYPSLATDWSYGRSPNAGPDWQVLLSPTPLIANDETPAIDVAPAPKIKPPTTFF